MKRFVFGLFTCLSCLAFASCEKNVPPTGTDAYDVWLARKNIENSKTESEKKYWKDKRDSAQKRIDFIGEANRISQQVREASERQTNKSNGELNDLSRDIPERMGESHQDRIHDAILRGEGKKQEKACE